MTTTQKRTHTPILLDRYTQKVLIVLNNSLAWNIAKLPNNTFELQLAKYEEELDEAIEADKEEDYNHLIEELADVLIVIGGMMRFDESLAIEMINDYFECLDKYIFMDVLDFAEQKIKILYDRDYSGGYRHKETIQ